MKHAFSSVSFGLAWALLASTVSAAPSDYETEEGYLVSIPYDPSSFSTSVTAFPIATTRVIDGYALSGRMIAATGRNVLLRTTDSWQPVATTDPDDRAMDPCFIKLTPSGETIALGTGLDQPLFVYPASLLSTVSPSNLKVTSGVKRYDHTYYDAAWRDERYIFLNGWAEAGSAIFVVDTEQQGPDAIRVFIDHIPGASAGVVFDRNGNLITGIGLDFNASLRTGELQIFTADDIEVALAADQALEYDDDGLLLARNVLSAAALTVDADNNLFVGGGDVFGGGGDIGYAGAIDQRVIARVLDGGAPLDRDSPEDFNKLAPDPCENDDSVGILYVEATDMLVVTANTASQPPQCADVDWSTGDPGAAHAYFSPDAPDQDDDGLPDGIDPNPASPEIFGRTELNRFMRAFGSSASDPNYRLASDLNEDGTVDMADYALFLDLWGLPAQNPVVN